MRYGLHTRHKRLWTACGFRPKWEVRLSFQYGYLYVAINPNTGDLIAVFLPDMSSESYEAFLDVVAQETGAKPIRLYRDNAPSHCSESVLVSENIELHEFPPYCPELNPVERLFQEIRKVLANEVFESLEAIEAVITKKLKEYWENPKALVKLTRFGWIQRADNAIKKHRNSDSLG